MADVRGDEDFISIGRQLLKGQKDQSECCFSRRDKKAVLDSKVFFQLQLETVQFLLAGKHPANRRNNVPDTDRCRCWRQSSSNSVSIGGCMSKQQLTS